MKSLAELQAIRDKARAQISVREGQEDGIRILVGMATCGIAAGARPVLTAFIDISKAFVILDNSIYGVFFLSTTCSGIYGT